MNKTAYLVGFLKLSGDKIEFIGSDVFSEENPTLEGHGLLQFVLLKASGKDYEDALVSLVESIRYHASISKFWAAILTQLQANSRAAGLKLLGLD